MDIDVGPAGTQPQWQARLVERTATRLVYHLSGASEAVLEYEVHTAHALVKLDGEVVGFRMALLSDVGRFPFHLPTASGPIPAVLTVQTTMWSEIMAVHLVVEGTALYSDTLDPIGKEEVIGRPVPSAAVPPVASLPVPTSSPAHDRDSPGTDAVAHCCPWRSTLVRRGWFYRLIRLEGPAEATVEYNARRPGFESVRVNGRALPPKFYHGSYDEFVCPCLDLSIPVGDVEVSAVLEARATSFLGLSAFRLSIGGEVVYTEGGWRSGLPVPASAPPLSPEQLPLAASEPQPDPSALPVVPPGDRR